MNLYLYLTAASSHPEKLIKAIIFQLLKKYKAQNTKHSDYIKYTMFLYRNHLERGHLPSTIRPYFREANRKVLQQEKEKAQQSQQESSNEPSPPTSNSRPSFLHFFYGRNELPSRIVRRLHDAHCPDFEIRLGLAPPKMCHSRAKNIGNLASQTRLHEPPGRPASYFIGEHHQGLDP